MKYSFTFPAPCNYEVKVDAGNDDEAVGKIIMAGEVHRKQVHPDMPPMTEDQVRSFCHRLGTKQGKQQF